MVSTAYYKKEILERNEFDSILMAHFALLIMAGPDLFALAFYYNLSGGKVGSIIILTKMVLYMFLTLPPIACHDDLYYIPEMGS